MDIYQILKLAEEFEESAKTLKTPPMLGYSESLPVTLPAIPVLDSDGLSEEELRSGSEEKIALLHNLRLIQQLNTKTMQMIVRGASKRVVEQYLLQLKRLMIKSDILFAAVRN